MQSQLIELEYGIAVTAAQTADVLGRRLLGRKTPDKWLSGTFEKSLSISKKELKPLIADDLYLDAPAKNALGNILGICYLADYSLEHKVRFDVDQAQKIVEISACTINIPINISRNLIERLVKLYEYEKGDKIIQPNNLELRYILKSTDILLLQVGILSCTGSRASPADIKALAAIDAALDILDDYNDIQEDSETVTDNPFVNYCKTCPPLSLFEKLIMPFCGLSAQLKPYTTAKVKCYIEDGQARITDVAPW